MAYLFRQKLKISELSDLKQSADRILIYEPERDLAALYDYHLQAPHFNIYHCPNLDDVKSFVVNFQPRILIFNIDQPHALFRLKSLLADFPQLFVISTGYDTGSETITRLMSAGASGHINRRLSRPQDLTVIVKNILHH